MSQIRYFSLGWHDPDDFQTVEMVQANFNTRCNTALSSPNSLCAPSQRRSLRVSGPCPHAFMPTCYPLVTPGGLAGVQSLVLPGFCASNLDVVGAVDGGGVIASKHTASATRSAFSAMAGDRYVFRASVFPASSGHMETDVMVGYLTHNPFAFAVSPTRAGFAGSFWLCC